VWRAGGPPTGTETARPLPAGKPAVTPAADGASRWLPPALILLATVAVVEVVFFAIGAQVSAWQSSTQLPGAPGAPPWLAPVGVIVVLAVVAARRLSRRPASARRQPTPRGWRRLLDSSVIGSALAAVFLVAAYVPVGSDPGGPTAAVRELPGQVNGLIQQAIARPEPGYPRIRIKRVGIDLMLVKGDGKTPPVKYEAFTYPGADHVLSQQTSPGNTYVYAHARAGMFGNLRDVNIGDTVEIDLAAGKINSYRVSEIHQSVNWKDFEWLQPTADDRVTLQTCNGWRDEDPRLIVVAHRVTETSTALAR
jgi:LPXTG-site transpeptidase (sortase) family protein